MTKRVLANGVFDFLHPGHIHYLRESAKLGDELHVVVTRDEWPSDKDIIIDEKDRLSVLQELECVDEAFLGSKDSIYETVEKADPNIVTLGYDQEFDEQGLEQGLRENGFDVEVKRISKGKNYSSSDFKQRL